MQITKHLHTGLSVLSKKLAIILIVLSALAFFTWSTTSRPSQSTQYTTVTAKRGPLVLSTRVSGSITSGSKIAINSRVSGLVKDVFVSNGEYVNAGDKIAALTLDPASLQKKTAAWADYLTAKNNLDIAKNQMNALQAVLFETNQTFVKGAGTQNPILDDPTYIIQKANWLKAESDYINQKNIITAAETALSSAWLAYTQSSDTITAPFSGYISDLYITPNSPVTGTADIVQSIGFIKLKDMKPTAVVNLTEIDVTKVRLGQKTTMLLDAFPDKTFSGLITAINTNGSVLSGVTTYPVTITFDTQEENIYPNMEISATIINKTKNDVLTLPISSIINQNGQNLVRVLNKNKVTLVPVITGDSTDTQTEIISGINEGDTIITGSVALSSDTSTQASFPFGSFGGGLFGGKQQLKIQMK